MVYVFAVVGAFGGSVLFLEGVGKLKSLFDEFASVPFAGSAASAIVEGVVTVDFLAFG